jgi:plastocyanin
MRRLMNRRVGAALMGATAVALGSVLVTAPMATASGGGDTQRVRMKDDCEPASFNAVLGPGACVGDGDTTFDDFIAQLSQNGFVANESADDWEFKPGRFHIDEGDRLRVVNVGGEFHTFTEVAEFGGGCVPDLNAAVGLPADVMIPECRVPKVFEKTGVAPGGKLHVHGLEAGTHKFECLIHPWMQSVVTVRADDDDHDDDRDDDDHSGHH